MRISTPARHFREGARSVLRNGWMSFASASSIAISLFILGVFLMLSMNVNYIAQQVEKQVEIQVYLDVNIPQDQIDALNNQIGLIPEVSKVTFVSKEEGLEFLRERMGEDGEDWLKDLDGDNNPLPDAFKVEVKDPTDVVAVADKILGLNEGQATEPISEVNYGKGTVETLFKVTRTIRDIGLILVIGLALTSMFLISNTIKLTIVARRREISIMKLVGATNGFIRWPFFIEGLLLGLIGAAVPVLLLLYGYSRLISYTNFDLGQLMIRLMPMDEIGFNIAVLLLCIGLVIGVWGSTISIRKFLKV